MIICNAQHSDFTKMSGIVTQVDGMHIDAHPALYNSAIDRQDKSYVIRKQFLNYLCGYAENQKNFEVELTIFSFNDTTIKFNENNRFTKTIENMHNNITLEYGGGNNE